MHVKYSIIICCYDEEANIEKTWNKLSKILPKNNEVIFVDDGSTDNTYKLISAIKDPRVHLISYTPNQGYGYALQKGIAAATGDFFILMDCDLAIDPKEILDAIDTNYDLNIFSRFKDVKCEYPLKRRIFSWGYRTMNKFLFKIPINDTQSGFLAFRKEIFVKNIELKSKGFSILLELIAKAHKEKCTIVEKGLKFVHSTESGETSVWEHVPKMLKESIGIWREVKK